MYKFSEYEYVSNYYFDQIDSDILPFALFAFFRSKIDDNVDLERLPIYIDALAGEKIFTDFFSDSAYREFERKFLSEGRYMVV